MDADYSITIGAKYSVNHGDEEQTVGVFKGFSAMGSETAMVFELENGTLRFISLSQIIYLDLLKDAPKEKASKEKETGSVYYG